jgi:hypothetical protein
MKDLPNAFYAGVFITQALVIAAMALYSHADQHIIVAVIALATNIVTGAFAYIQGHKDGAAVNGSIQEKPNPVVPSEETK